MRDYYRRDGTLISGGAAEWAPLFRDLAYKRVAETTLPDGRWVSTVWIGLDHNWGDGPPLIFETMVFLSKDELSERYCERYATEALARRGHARVVELLTLGAGPSRYTRTAPFEPAERRIVLEEGG